MARIAKSKVAEREAFLRDLFSKTPGMTAAKANQALADRGEPKMRSVRVYEIKRETGAAAEGLVTQIEFPTVATPNPEASVAPVATATE